MNMHCLPTDVKVEIHVETVENRQQRRLNYAWKRAIPRDILRHRRQDHILATRLRPPAPSDGVPRLLDPQGVKNPIVPPISLSSPSFSQ